jgi:tRNA (cytidine/uridine-2'-O-)-methyltransferase
MPHLALYQPDIPQNTGAMMRLCACLGVPMHIIEPCGFFWDTKKIHRVAMDYIDHLTYTRHDNWETFYGLYGKNNDQKPQKHRLVLLTTQTTQSYTDFCYQPDDILMVGRESAGVPDAVANQCHACVTIPLSGAVRSLNVTHAAAMGLGEAMRQIK